MGKKFIIILCVKKSSHYSLDGESAATSIG